MGRPSKVSITFFLLRLLLQRLLLVLAGAHALLTLYRLVVVNSAILYRQLAHYLDVRRRRATARWLTITTAAGRLLA